MKKTLTNKAYAVVKGLEQRYQPSLKCDGVRMGLAFKSSVVALSVGLG